MKLLKTIAKYGLLIGSLGLSSCWDFRDNTNELYRQKAIENLPVSEIYLAPKIDVDLDNDDDCLIVGKLLDNYRDDDGRLVGKDKCGAFFLENEGQTFKVHTLEDKLERYPEVLHTWIGTVKGKDITISIDNIAKKGNKMVLTLETCGEEHKAYLDQKPKAVKRKK